MTLGRTLAVSLALLSLLLSAPAVQPLAGAASSANGGFVFSAAGDFGSWGGYAATLKMLKQSNSTFALALGDLSYGGETEQKWCGDFKNALNDVEIVSGSAEAGLHIPYQGNINNFTQYCPFTLATTLQGVYGKQYAFDYPATNPIARFVVVSPDVRFSVDNGELYNYSVGMPRYNWTRDAIDGARAAGIPWVIVAMYKNCIGTGEHPCEIGTDFLNLLVDRKVDLIVQTRTHGYERSAQLALDAAACPAIRAENYTAGCVVNPGSDGRYVKGQGSVIVISGTGGRQLETLNPSDGDAPYFAKEMGNGTPGGGNGVVTFSVTRTQISMHTNFNQTFADSFTITAAAPTTASPSIPPILLVPMILAPIAVAVAGYVILRPRKSKGTKQETGTADESDL